MNPERNLIALYRLEFYKKQSNWQFAMKNKRRAMRRKKNKGKTPKDSVTYNGPSLSIRGTSPAPSAVPPLPGAAHPPSRAASPPTQNVANQDEIQEQSVDTVEQVPPAASEPEASDAATGEVEGNDATTEEVVASDATTGDLETSNATTGDLETSNATIEEVEADTATTEEVEAGNASTGEFEPDNASTEEVEANASSEASASVNNASESIEPQSQNKKSVCDASTSTDNPEDQVPNPSVPPTVTEDHEACDFKIPDYETFEYDSETEPREPDLSANAYGPTPYSIFQNQPEPQPEPVDNASQYCCCDCRQCDYSRYYNSYEVAVEQNNAQAQAMPVYWQVAPEPAELQYGNQVCCPPEEWQPPMPYGYEGWADEAAALPPADQQVSWSERISEANDMALAMQRSLTITEYIEPTDEHQPNAEAQNMQYIPGAYIPPPSGNRRHQIVILPGSYFSTQPDIGNQLAYIPGAYVAGQPGQNGGNQLAEWQWYPSEPS